MNLFSPIIGSLMLFVLGVCAEVRIEVYEYFDNVHASSLDDAKETCELRGGKLASDPSFDDWDNFLVSHSLETDVLLDTYFTVNVKKSSGVWQYADGTPVDMTSTKALTLRELDSGQHGSNDYDCALWNPWEPFFVPSKCTDYNAFICATPVTLYTTCSLEETDNTHFIGTWPGFIEFKSDVTESDCTSRCVAVDGVAPGTLPCWAVEYDQANRRCTLLRSDEKPKLVPEIQSQQGRKTFMKNCKVVAAFQEDTCSVLCKCNTQNVVVIPTDQKEYDEFVEKVVQKQIRELTVPTSNLSSTIRKKTSAKDERESSTGMGALGIALLTLTFGCLMALDLIGLCGDIKTAIENGSFGQFQRV